MSFVSSDTTCVAVREMASKRTRASAAVRAIIYRGGNVVLGYQTKNNYNAMVKSVMIYSAEVWDFQYEGILEWVWVGFLKARYCGLRNTTGYIVIQETRVNNLKIEIFKRAYNMGG